MAYFLNLRINGIQLLFKYFCFFFFALTLAIAHADEFDTFNLVGSSSYSHDSNLFRLPSGVQPSSSGSERSDNIFRNSIGFTLDKKYSLQAFKANFDHIETSYDNAKFLDFKANNYKAAWLWALTPSLTGILSADRTVALVPFQDLRSGANGLATNLSQQNIRTNELQVLSVDFSPHDTWHVIGGYNKLNVQNSQTFLPETSFKLDTVEGGVKYKFPSQSYVSFITRKSDGQNQDTNTNPVVAVGSGFEEKQQEITSFWLITGKSRLSANIGHISRIDDTFDIRDFSGNFGGLNYIWDISGKTSLSIGASRRLSAFQTRTDSYGITDTIFINPSWYATSKIVVKANAQIGRRSFKGNGPVVSNFEREDNTIAYGLGIDWIPRNTIKIGVNLQHDQRNSNVNDFDYSANIASINGQLTF